MKGTQFIPVLILIGPRRERTRGVSDAIRRLQEQNHRRNSHIGELREIDEEPILSVWREEDAILERHGMPRVHTDADGRFADEFLRYVLVDRVARACETALEADPQGRSTVVARFGCTAGNGGYADALSRFGDSLLDAAAVLYVDANADTPDDRLRMADWNDFASAHSERLYVSAATGPARIVPYVVIDSTAGSADAPSDTRVQEALDALWKRWQALHIEVEADQPSIENSRENSRDSFRIVARDESHFAAHAEELLVERSEVESIIRAELSRGVREGSVRRAVRHSRVVGYSGLQRVRLHNRRSFWAPRPARVIPSHLIAGRRRRTRWLCFWGEWQDAETFILHTFYAGKPAPREIHDPDATAAELKSAIEFWSTHAIIVAEADHSERDG